MARRSNSKKPKKSNPEFFGFPPDVFLDTEKDRDGTIYLIAKDNAQTLPPPRCGAFAVGGSL